MFATLAGSHKVSDCLIGLPLYMLQAGNVVTGEMVEELILSGADIIKVGIGPGEWLELNVCSSCPRSEQCRPHMQTDTTAKFVFMKCILLHMMLYLM